MTYQIDTSVIITIPPSDAVPKKYKNSGLITNKEKTKKDQRPAVAFGGLDGEHIEQENPFPVRNDLPPQVEYPPNLRRDTSRKNGVIFCKSSSHIKILTK
jgi:hypothetical protein